MDTERSRSFRRWAWFALGALLLLSLGWLTYLWLRDEPPPDLSSLIVVPSASGPENQAFGLFVRAEAALQAEDELEDLLSYFRGTGSSVTDAVEARQRADSLIQRNRTSWRLLHQLSSQDSVTLDWKSQATYHVFKRAGVLLELEFRTHLDRGDLVAAVASAIALSNMEETLRRGGASLLQLMQSRRFSQQTQECLWLCVVDPRITHDELLRIQRAIPSRFDDDQFLQAMVGELLLMQSGSSAYRRGLLKPNRTVRRLGEVARFLGDPGPAIPPKEGWGAYYSGRFARTPWSWATGDFVSEDMIEETSALWIGLRIGWMRQSARQSILFVATALRRYHVEHGALPPELEALTPKYIDRVPEDPFGRAPIRYLAEVPALYVVGENGRDENGAGDDVSMTLDFPPGQ